MTTTIKEDLATEILRRRRRQMPRLTAALAAAVLVAVGILAGVEIQKHWGSGSASGTGSAGGNASSLRAAFASRFGGSGAARGFTGGAGAFGAPGGGFGGGATGTVTLVKGSDIYVTESSGNTVIVHTAGSQVTKTVTGSARSIHPGDTVSVSGTQAANGSWKASRIALTPAGSSNG